MEASRFGDFNNDHGATKEWSAAEAYNWEESLCALLCQAKASNMPVAAVSDSETIWTPLPIHHASSRILLGESSQ